MRLSNSEHNYQCFSFLSGFDAYMTCISIHHLRDRRMVSTQQLFKPCTSPRSFTLHDTSLHRELSTAHVTSHEQSCSVPAFALHAWYACALQENRL